MERFESSINISNIMLAQRDIQSLEGEKLTDKIDINSICQGEVCGLNWKPININSDAKREGE